jgi:hypothetical protein
MTWRASATLVPGERTSKEVPPSKSRPRFRPRTPNEASPTSTATVEMTTARRHRLGKSTADSPR